MSKKIYRRYVKSNEIKDAFGFACSCHNSLGEHFEEIVREDGKDIAEAVFMVMIKDLLKAQKKAMIEAFNNFLKDLD